VQAFARAASGAFDECLHGGVSVDQLSLHVGCVAKRMLLELAIILSSQEFSILNSKTIRLQLFSMFKFYGNEIFWVENKKI